MKRVHPEYKQLTKTGERARCALAHPAKAKTVCRSFYTMVGRCSEMPHASRR